ncbi:hypothetical protein [Legionella longbeachae]|uniref:Uncharacterized protein n=1 Tax=Legionella longbeachae serogroup 1 (strain NSW150) TaxID=661367 RepID=D3HPW6_LEGLN|nr:hypothetical protein [Legionella longbeachae]VEE01451.1 Uncharacterised protein [Legionella oakridgensis]HBD7396169.1 hypothetical protein [Legionella pneumophila]ARB92188.1 hypothetical protein A6J40_08360 [Legionella longbeachae]ARM34632.1 hypothetical protein B0B39_14365 [Legionella longbeachae]EEZ96068.1 hypothetical protein LLB_1251 [Legionella longbeachae D-4968]
MLKFKLSTLAILSVTSSLCFGALPTDGIFPAAPGIYPPLFGKKTYDVLVDLVPGGANPLNAFGADGGVQGMIRNTGAVDLFGVAVPSPQGPLPLTRGYQFLVAGYVYPANSLDSCTKNPSTSCNPSQKPIGNWLCSGWALADANQNPWPKGKALNAATMMFNITQTVPNEPQYKGIFTSTLFEANAFADVGTQFEAPINGGTGSFTHINEMTVVPLGFVGAQGFQPGLKVALRVTVKKALFLDESEKSTQ